MPLEIPLILNNRYINQINIFTWDLSKDLSKGWVSNVTTSGKWNCCPLLEALPAGVWVKIAGLDGVLLLQLDVFELESGPPCAWEIKLFSTQSK